MKDYDNNLCFDMHSFGRELCELSAYRDMYYRLEDEHKELNDKYMELLNQTHSHNQDMMGGWLKLAVKIGEES